MPALEDISTFNFSSDHEDDDEMAVMNNLDTTIQVSPTLTIRIHKDRPIKQVIRDLHSATQTRNMSKNLEEHEFITTIHQRTNHKDLQNCLFACFLSQEEPKKVIHALKDPSWIEATQEELLQFKLQEFWTLVDLPYGKRAIGTKWVFWNKKDEIDFVVYKMDVKSAFIYGKIEKEVYVCQPLGFKDPDIPDKVGKIDKTLFIIRYKDDILLVQVYDDDIIFGSTKKELCNAFEMMMHEKFQMSSIGELTFFIGLQVKQKQDRIFISQDKYVDEILKKYGFSELKNASTLMETQKRLSRMKMVKKYLNGHPKLGLWYPKDSPFDLVAYTDNDYAGATLDKKSTTGGFEQIVDFLHANPIKHALTVNPTVYTSCIEQFWATIKAKTVNMEVQLQALVDGKKVIITQFTIRIDLQLEDAKGVDCLPNATIFKQLTLMRVGKDFSGRETPLFPTMMVQAPEEMGEDKAVNEDMDCNNPIFDI
uniref:Reverse transcriptase Ty1/copia-type domain-containing protein n=1 Tax=Tanacetum cinerariifolium TaxID=118510 RepID=A0A6L2MHP2_TANCI|nr:hypothetical protein [Tanacetum cinerariifolium]